MRSLPPQRAPVGVKACARLCSASESLHILIGVALGIGAGILADSLCAISVGDGSECTYLPEGGECEV